MDGPPPPGPPPVAPPPFRPLPQRVVPFPPPPVPRPHDRPARRVGAWLLGGGIVALCVVGASVLTWNYLQSRRIAQRSDSVEEKYRETAGVFAEPAPGETADPADASAEAERAAVTDLFDRFNASVA